MRNDLERIYFYWSFGLLIIRTVCLCLFGAKVNDESTKPMLVLNSVSSDIYNLEVIESKKKKLNDYLILSDSKIYSSNWNF